MGWKDIPNIVFKQTAQHRTKNEKTHNRTTLKIKNLSNTDLTKKPAVSLGIVSSEKH
jgi:hypothetical protein